MRLIPSAIVNIVFSESPITVIKKPKLSMNNICVYNHSSYGGTKIKGSAIQEVLTSEHKLGD